MSFATQTVVETTTELMSPASIGDDTITVTSHFFTTLQATHGQTITIGSPLADRPETTTEYVPTPSTVTVTETELDIYLRNAGGDVYSTWIIALPPAQYSPSESPHPLVYVIEPTAGGWDDWSRGRRAGLIVGVVVAALVLFAMIACFFGRRSNVWLAHHWPAAPFSGPMAPRPPPGHFVQPRTVNGPIVPYNYGQPAYGYGVGMRGGGDLNGNMKEHDKKWYRIWRRDGKGTEEETAEEDTIVQTPGDRR